MRVSWLLAPALEEQAERRFAFDYSSEVLDEDAIAIATDYN